MNGHQTQAAAMWWESGPILWIYDLLNELQVENSAWEEKQFNSSRCSEYNSPSTRYRVGFWFILFSTLCYLALQQFKFTCIIVCCYFSICAAVVFAGSGKKEAFFIRDAIQTHFERQLMPWRFHSPNRQRMKDSKGNSGREVWSSFPRSHSRATVDVGMGRRQVLCLWSWNAFFTKHMRFKHAIILVMSVLAGS